MKLTIAAMVCVALMAGCQQNKKSATSPAMHAAALDVSPAPAAQYTPPPAPQPVVYDTPAQQPQPVMAEAVADASDSVAAAPAPAPQRQAAPRKMVSQSSARGTKYTVKKGESLWTIAQSHYGNGSKWKQIAAANPKINPDKVQAGQTIILP